MLTEGERITVFDKYLDTLAQSGTDNTSYSAEAVVFGEGADRSNSSAMKGRAKRKLITQKMTFYKALLEFPIYLSSKSSTIYKKKLL